MYIITIRIIIIRQLLNLNKFRQVSELYEIAPMGLKEYVFWTLSIQPHNNKISIVFIVVQFVEHLQR